MPASSGRGLRPLLNAFALGVPLFFVSQALISCGSDNKAGAKVCTPVEDLKACTCGNQRTGTQACNADGTGYDACNCDGTASAGAGGSSNSGAAGSSSSGTAGSAGSANAPGLTGGVGLPCATDADCPGAPLVCVPSSSDAFGATDPTTGITVKGGPQGGYCTLPCTGSAQCQAVDAAAACNTALQYCFALCQPSSTGTAKCVDAQGNPLAQACYQLDPTDTSLGACIPTCTNDAGCGGGRYCDLNTGLCVSTKPTGKAIGEKCDASLSPSDCASGECVEFGSGASFCSGTCTLGVTNNCGYDPQVDTKREAGCIEPQFDNPGVGDIGFCVEMCDTDSDCAQAADGWTCLALSAAGAQIFGRTGECAPPNLTATDAGPG